ncbi:MAG: prolipoprotein diacylglyceryl transferase [Sandaracinaceae bacterium]
MQIDVGYVAIMLSAVVAGILVRRHVAEPTPLSRPQRLALLLGAVIGGTLGAKLPYVLSDPEGAISGMAWFRDGRTLTWGLVGGYFGVELAKLLAQVRGKTGDGFAVPVAVSVAFGRLGCFYAGCCFGQPTSLPWGVDFGDGQHRHPNQLYEVAFHLGMATLLYALGKRGKFKSQRIKLYLITYMAFRLISETWRPEPRLALGLTFYQWSALAFLILFVGLWIWDAKRLPATTGPRTATSE